MEKLITSLLELPSRDSHNLWSTTHSAPATPFSLATPSSQPHPLLQPFFYKFVCSLCICVIWMSVYVHLNISLFIQGVCVCKCVVAKGGGVGAAAAAEPIKIRGLLLAESPGRCVIYKEAAVVLCL